MAGLLVGADGGVLSTEGKFVLAIPWSGLFDVSNICESRLFCKRLYPDYINFCHSFSTQGVTALIFILFVCSHAPLALIL